MFDDLPLWAVIMLIGVLVIGTYVVERVRGRNPYAVDRRRRSGPDGSDAGGSQRNDCDLSGNNDSGGDGGDGD